jgi:hypothetical protein
LIILTHFQGTSYSLTEYYDIVNRRGRLDFVKSNDVNGTFIYDAVTQETFFINGGTCTLGNINNKPPFLKRMIDDYWTAGFSMERTILGPSVFLRAILNNQQGIVRLKFSICYSINSIIYFVLNSNGDQILRIHPINDISMETFGPLTLEMGLWDGFLQVIILMNQLLNNYSMGTLLRPHFSESVWLSEYGNTYFGICRKLY